MADGTFNGYVRAMRVHIPVLRDCTAFVPIGYADLLRKSAALPGSRPIEVTLVGETREVVAAGGVRLRCDASLDGVRRSDLVLVPPVDPDVPAHLELNRAVVPWLRRVQRAGADVASACTGAFLLAEAGLLDGKAATTHWAFQPLFAHRYPRVRLRPQAIVVDQGRTITAGGATSFLSLALYVVERIFGADVARMASRMFLIDVNKSPQGAYAIFGTQKDHGDEEILRAQEIVESDVARCPPIEELGRRVGMSRRSFVRRFKSATGDVPRDYVQRVRVEAAKRELEKAGPSISTIASRVGYSDVVAFRHLFTRWTGLSPSDWRARYGPRRGVITRPDAILGKK